MKIGGAQIQPQANEHASARAIEGGAAGIVKRRFGDIEHQQLLRQHLRHLTRRNVKTVQRHRKITEVIARKLAPRAILLIHPDCANVCGAHTAPRLAADRRVHRIAVEHALRERMQIGPMPHMHAHADDGDWLEWLEWPRSIDSKRGWRSARRCGRSGRRSSGRCGRCARLAADGSGLVTQPLLNQQVRIDTAKPETIHCRTPWHICATALPRLALLQNRERTVRQAHLV